MWNECPRAGAVGRNGLRTRRRRSRGATGRAQRQGGLLRQLRDIQNIWSDLEARQVLNKRVLEGGTHSINVRIVTPKDAPLAHAASLDIWLVQAGSATAVTGGELLDAKKRPNSDDVAGSTIKGGTEQPLKPGDVLYVRQACRTVSRTSMASGLF